MRKKRFLVGISSTIVFALGIGFALGFSSKKEMTKVEASTLNNDGYDANDYHYYSGTYYDSVGNNAISTGGTTLLSALCGVVQPGSAFGYKNLWTLYHTSDVYPNDYDGTDPLTGNEYPTTKSASSYRGKIWDMYGDTTYTPGSSAQGASYSKVGDAYNREHTVPQSWFNESTIPQSDPHHIFATDGYVNNQRSNYPYGEVSGSKTVHPNGFGGLGSPVSTYGSCGDTKVFEPEDAYKGDIARGVMYMAVAYYNFSGSFTYSNSCFTRSNNKNLLSSYYINLLTKWSAEDPVSQKEIDRNNVIFASSQGNRNPFIDHPNWAYKIWGGTEYTWNDSGSSTDPKVNSVTVTPGELTLDLNGTTSANLTATVSVSNAAPQTVTWSSTNTSVATVNSSGVVTALAVGTTTIKATSTYNSNKYGTCALTVKDSSQGGGGSAGNGTIYFNNDGGTAINDTSVTGDDDLDNTWTITTVGTTSFTANSAYYQVGSSSKPATSITFTTSFSSTMSITNFSAKFGGFTGTAGTVTLKVDSTTVGTGSLNATSDVVVNQSSSGQGDSLTVSVTGISKGVKAYYISYTCSTPSGDPVLESIELDTTNVNKVFTVGDTFSYSGLVVTAFYSDDSSQVITSGYTVTSPDMTTPGTKEVNVEYEGKEESYEIIVNPAAATSITASVSKTYYVGETISASDITVKDNNNVTVTDFTFASNNYRFQYSDASSGGALTNKMFTNEITYGTLKCSLTVQVQRKARVTPSSGSKGVTYTDLPTAYQTTTEVRTAASGIKFIAYNCANYSSKMQFKASGGYLKTTEPMSLKTLTIYNRESNTLTVYGGTSASSITTVITGTNDVYDLSGYTYLMIKRTSSGVAYCSNITIEYGESDSAANLANYIMYEDTNNQCTTKFNVAKGYFENLSKDDRATFMTSDDYVISTARDRLQKWAAHLGKTISYSGGDYVISSSRTSVINSTINSNNALISILVVFVLGTTMIGAYLLIKKKKSNNKQTRRLIYEKTILSSISTIIIDRLLIKECF